MLLRAFGVSMGLFPLWLGVSARAINFSRSSERGNEPYPLISSDAVDSNARASAFGRDCAAVSYDLPSQGNRGVMRQHTFQTVIRISAPVLAG